MDDKTKEGLERCIPIAQEVIRIIARHKIKLGKLSNEEKDKYYDPIAQEVLNLMIEKNLLYMEKDFVFQLALQALEETKNKVVNSLQITWENMLKKYLGKDFIDVTLADLNKKIQETKS